MKNKVLYLSLSLILLPLFSCDNKDIVWDFMCWNISLSATNSSGIDLLDPFNSSTLLSENTYVEYKDKRYELVIDEKIHTRANIAHWNGFRLEFSPEDQKYYVLFGEFDPTRNYKGEEFTIHWNEHQKDVISFDMYITWKRNNPKVHRKLYINGKQVPTDTFTGEITDKFGNDMIWDFRNWDIEIEVEDADGNDLLDEYYENNILGDGIYVVYNKKNYILEVPSRATLPDWHGLIKSHDETTGRGLLLFGEFEPFYKNTSFELFWGDESSDVVSFDLYNIWYLGTPTVNKTVYLNGKVYSYNSLRVKIFK